MEEADAAGTFCGRCSHLGRLNCKTLSIKLKERHLTIESLVFTPEIIFVRDAGGSVSSSLVFVLTGDIVEGCVCVCGGAREGPSSAEGHEVKWNPRTEKRQEPRGAQWTFFLSHHTCLQEEAVMSPTSHLGTMVAGRKQQVARGGGRREEGREGLSRGLKKLSVLFTMDTMFWPLRLEHNNTCGFKFLLSPVSLSPSFNSAPASLSYIIWLRLKDMNFPSIETSL